MIGLLRFTLPLTTIIDLVSACAPPSPWNLSAYCPCVAVMPSKPVRKSTCQKPRRNSPSVTDCRPAASCSATAFLMEVFSTSVNDCREILPALKSARACLSSGGRNRLPTWSARNGGLLLRIAIPPRRTAYSGKPPMSGTALAAPGDMRFTIPLAAALGATAMYLLDPQQGRRRRAMVRDQIARRSREAAHWSEGAARDVAHRA